MLVLSRKINQSIMVGDNVRIVVVAVDRDQVKLGIEAPRDISVHRSEIYEEIQRANQSVAAGPVPTETVGAGKATIQPRKSRKKATQIS
ncbi:MAG: carbon storage regulator CsrA [Candidatus Eremiobacteraeota bacterium]|nr:carbon storage regulator CsrA [Candidatus Eremiobacteraeota bacterium]